MPLKILALALVAASLAACQTPTFAEYVEGANKLDPDCYKKVHVQATPMMIFGWAVPVFGGEYDKICHPELIAPGARQPVAVGAVIGGLPVTQ